MALLIEPETPRLLLRQWSPADRIPFAALNADPRVMAHFPALLSTEVSDRLADRLQGLIETRGWGAWAVSLKDTGEFIGYVGLHIPSPLLPFSPCTEIAWRLAYPYWGKGLAMEAAQAALAVGFDQLGLEEIVAFTTLSNLKSQALMQRLHMQADGRFEHPLLPEGHSLRSHYLYRLPRIGWEARQALRVGSTPGSNDSLTLNVGGSTDSTRDKV